MRRVRVVSLERTCGHSPSQWEGRLDDGRHVFIHYRHSSGTIGVGATLDEAVDDTISGSPLHTWQGGGETPGFMLDAQVLTVLRDVLDAHDDVLLGAR